jgi:hypothetical protein
MIVCLPDGFDALPGAQKLQSHPEPCKPYVRALTTDGLTCEVRPHKPNPP